MNRRTFILSLAGASAAAGLATWKGRASDRFTTGSLEKVSRSANALGTSVRITVYHPDREKANAAVEAAFNRLDAVEDVMSLYRPESDICRLNREGQLQTADAGLLEVLALASRVSHQSGGRFDITVQPLYTLHARHASAGTRPSEAELKATCERVGWQRVKIEDQGIRLDGPDTRITLNGIAQGYAADAVGAVLAAHGVQHAFIDTGEIGTLGQHASRRHWNVGIKHPRNDGELLAVARLEGRAMATSGDYETRFDDTYQSHHIINPSTGRSPVELSSVTVVAKTAMEADAYSTAVLLLGLDEGRRFIEQIPGADALFIDKHGAMSRTAGFPEIG